MLYNTEQKKSAVADGVVFFLSCSCSFCFGVLKPPGSIWELFGVESHLHGTQFQSGARNVGRGIPRRHDRRRMPSLCLPCVVGNGGTWQ